MYSCHSWCIKKPNAPIANSLLASKGPFGIVQYIMYTYMKGADNLNIFHGQEQEQEQELHLNKTVTILFVLITITLSTIRIVTHVKGFVQHGFN